MDTSMPKNLERAQKVKKMREERAWTQSQLADVANINLRTVQRLERDGAASFDTLMAIATAFVIDVKELSPVSKTRKKDEPETKKIYLIPRLITGKNLVDVIGGADLYQIEHDSAEDPRAVNAMAGVLDEVKKDIVRYYDADPGEKLRIELYLTKEIKGLDDWGFYLFGIKRDLPRIIGDQKIQTTMCTIYMSHAGSPKIVRDKNSNMMVFPIWLPQVRH
jgi:transcriptional regulator with XRE-family HTH domain